MPPSVCYEEDVLCTFHLVAAASVGRVAEMFHGDTRIVRSVAISLQGSAARRLFSVVVVPPGRDTVHRAISSRAVHGRNSQGKAVSWLRTGIIVVVSVTSIVAMSTSAMAQNSTPPDDARVHAGPVTLSPTIAVTNLGHDNNVYFEADHPRSDFTATVSPAVQGWMSLGQMQLTGRSQIDAVYYKELSDLRAIDTDHSGMLQVRLNRLAPYVSGTRALTRHRRNLEIDAPVRRLDQGWSVGADLRLTAKTTVGAAIAKSNVEYEGDTLYFGSDLAELLNRRSTAEHVVFRYELTPLTTIAVEAQRGRDRFVATPDRDSNSWGIAPVVEFKPLALISGRAQIGWRRHRFLDGEIPEFRGVFAQVNLRYTLLGRTQFEVGAQRDLGYSYLLEEQQYVISGLSLSVTHTLVEPWEVTGRVGRYSLDYQTSRRADLGESIPNYGAGLIYRLGRTRIGVQLDHFRRRSDVSRQRQSTRTLVSSSITHTF